MAIETVCEFIGWCTVINFGLMAFGIVKVMVVRNWASKVHGKMFDIEEAWVRQAYFQFFAYYKIAIVVFNLVPYIALRIMVAS